MFNKGIRNLVLLGLLQGAMLNSAFALEPVNINTASAEVIAKSLQNIGLKKAEAIVKYREANGEFTSVAQLSSVKGIGEKTLEKNQEYIRLK